LQHLRRISATNNVRLLWVPGHSGILGNEKADELANIGSADVHIEGKYICGISMGTVKSHNKGWILDQFQKYWNQMPKLRQSKIFINGTCPKRTKELLSLCKKHLRWIVGIFTGHGKFRYHLKKMKLTEDDVCRFCGIEPETAEHLLCSCTALQNCRYRFFGDPYPDPPDYMDFELRDVIGFLEKSKIFE
jgi:hypothetical protein